jgi:hypothetical protein
LASRDTEELQPLLDDLEQLKAEGLTVGVVAICFCSCLIQPIKDRAHPAFEYWGQSDPTQVVKSKVYMVEMTARVKNIFGGQIRNWECPKALGIYNPSDLVCLQPRFIYKLGLQKFYLCPAPLHDKDQRTYKVRNAADVQASPPHPSTNTSTTRWWGATMKLLPHHVGCHPRLPRRGIRDR